MTFAAPSPLAGIRVLDLSRLLPGAFASLMLAELGAEVIKIEDPRGGDPMRHLPPFVRGRSVYDLLLNRGKKSVAIDLKSEAMRQPLSRLIATADIVIESFRPATARRLGVDAETLRRTRSGLVHCSITGYGQHGPYAELPGHDLNYVAISGMLAADRPDPYNLPRMFIADVGGGAMTAVIGILAALFGRSRHGHGASLDISMHDAALYWVMLPAARELIDDGHQAEGELPTFGSHASYNVYETSDGRLIALGALERKFWDAFCAAAGRPDLAPRHDSEPADQARLIAELRALFATRTCDSWLALLAGHDVCATRVNTPAEALADPHIAARGVVARAEGLRTIRPPFLSQAPDLAPAPDVGAHTDEIFKDL